MVYNISPSLEQYSDPAHQTNYPSIMRRKQPTPDRIDDGARKFAKACRNSLAFDRLGADITAQEAQYTCGADALTRRIDRSIQHAAIRPDHENCRNRYAAHFARVVQIPCADDCARRVAKQRKR